MSFIDLPLWSRYWREAVADVASLPAVATEGEVRYVKDVDKLYTYDGAAWNELSGGGGGAAEAAWTAIATAGAINNLAFSTGALKLSAATSVTGVVAQADGAELIIFNDTSSAITIAAESGSSTAANRFTTPGSANLLLAIKKAVRFKYSTATSRWIIAESFGSTRNFQLYTSSGSFVAPADVIDIFLLAGGGGGQGGGAGGGGGGAEEALGSTGGGGGGAGGTGACGQAGRYIVLRDILVTRGNTYSFTIGAGGTGGAGDTGGTGGIGAVLGNPGTSTDGGYSGVGGGNGTDGGDTSITIGSHSFSVAGGASGYVYTNISTNPGGGGLSGNNGGTAGAGGLGNSFSGGLAGGYGGTAGGPGETLSGGNNCFGYAANNFYAAVSNRQPGLPGNPGAGPGGGGPGGGSYPLYDIHNAGVPIARVDTTTDIGVTYQMFSAYNGAAGGNGGDTGSENGSNAAAGNANSASTPYGVGGAGGMGGAGGGGGCSGEGTVDGGNGGNGGDGIAGSNGAPGCLAIWWND